VIRATISIAPAVQQQLKGPTPLFVLARDPAGGGPPLAAQRRSSAEAPLSIELSEADAMMPSRTIATVPRVKVVARLSLSGAPQEHSGDFYGEADYDFSKDTGTLQIVIDRTVP
jgi:cytochrome c-type biogenesis protein CcmH